MYMCVDQYREVICAQWRLASPATRRFIQQFGRTNKEQSGLHITGYLWEESTNDL